MGAITLLSGSGDCAPDCGFAPDFGVGGVIAGVVVLGILGLLVTIAVAHSAMTHTGKCLPPASGPCLAEKLLKAREQDSAVAPAERPTSHASPNPDAVPATGPRSHK